MSAISGDTLNFIKCTYLFQFNMLKTWDSRKTSLWGRKLDSHGDRRLFRKSYYIPCSLQTLFYECLFLLEFISLSYVYSNLLKNVYLKIVYRI